MKFLGIVVVIIILVAISIAGYFKLKPQNQTQNITQETSTGTKLENQIPKSDQIVKMTKSGFDPENVSVKAGESVTWVNEDTEPHWPASNDHPNHTVYPGFDAKKPIQAGESYTFVFEKVGSWGFHDHLNSRKTGTVTVSE